MKLKYLIVLNAFLLCYCAENDTSTQNPSSAAPTTRPPTQPPPKETTASPVVTTEPLSPAEDCARRNSSCKECLKSAKCLWCYTDNSCKLYPAGDILPHSDLCPLDKARWGVCWVNFKVLIIVLSSLGGLLVLGVTICICCCCCCKKGRNSSIDKDEAKFERQKMERKAKNDEKKAERKKRTDEIRRKYGIEFKGLIKDDNPYQRFDEA